MSTPFSLLISSSYQDVVNGIQELLKDLKSRFDATEGTAAAKEIEEHNKNSWELISGKIAKLADQYFPFCTFNRPFYNILADFLASDDLLDAHRAKGLCNVLSKTREFYDDYIDAYLAHAHIKTGNIHAAKSLITTPDLQRALNATRIYIDSRKALLAKNAIKKMS